MDSMRLEDFSLSDLFGPTCWMDDSNSDEKDAPFFAVTTRYNNAVKIKVVEHKYLEENLLLETPEISDALMSAAGKHITMLYSDEWSSYEHEAMHYVWWCTYKMLALFHSEERILEVSKAWVESKCEALIHQFVETIERWDEVKDFPIEWSISLMQNSDRNFENRIWSAHDASRILKLRSKKAEDILGVLSWFGNSKLRV